MSLCGGEAQGTVTIGEASYTLDFSARDKRAAENIMEEESVTLRKVETKVEGECGINQRNKAKMKVGERPVVRLRRGTRRSKRASKERTIEVAVFVDDVMYSRSEGKKPEGVSTEDFIQDIVFTYMNAVQQIYSSSKLDSKLRLVLVRLVGPGFHVIFVTFTDLNDHQDIMSAAPADLDKRDGDIETYLENFCRQLYLFVCQTLQIFQIILVGYCSNGMIQRTWAI